MIAPGMGVVGDSCSTMVKDVGVPASEEDPSVPPSTLTPGEVELLEQPRNGKSTTASLEYDRDSMGAGLRDSAPRFHSHFFALSLRSVAQERD